MKRLPGFRFDSKAGRASFEVIVPGTRGGVGRRETAEAAEMADALTGWTAFRERALVGDLGLAAPQTPR